LRAWFTHIDGTRGSALRRVGGAVWCVSAVVVGIAPFASTRSADQRVLYLVIATVLAIVGLVLLTSQGWSDRWGALVAVTVPTAAVLVLLALTNQVGSMAMLLAWPALASPYFPQRSTLWGNLGLLAGGMAAVVVLTPDPRVSWFSGIVTVVACWVCAITVRLIAVHNDAIVVSLSDRAVRDPLTGLLNRRAFDERLDELWAEGGRMAVVFFDLDHFKIVNDTYGHPVGDAVLREFAKVLRGHVRDGDVVARTGGEEFGVVMPGRGDTNLLERAQAVVDAFAATRIPANDLVLRCTVSAGLSLREGRHTSASHLCRDADRALYLAKEGGRNQAVLRDGELTAQG
jgi:diguanylate cyclase (GGDEF)-like protein